MFAVSGKHPYDVILQAAQKLRSSRLFIDQSSRVSRDFQEQSLLAALERLEPPRPTVVIEIVPKNGRRANSSEAFGTSCRIALVAFDRFRTRYPIAGDTGQSKRESRRFRVCSGYPLKRRVYYTYGHSLGLILLCFAVLPPLTAMTKDQAGPMNHAARRNPA